MFQCDQCQTEYGGIRGLDSGTCPRCREAPASRPALASPVFVFTSSARSEDSPATDRPIPAEPLTGAIARLDQAVRS
jgi:hypothetical protein